MTIYGSILIIIMCCNPETEDCPSQSKRARLATEEMKEFDVSEVKECNSASIHGVIVRVSQLHKTRNSSAKYFTAEVTDGKKTLKFICHDPPFRDPIVELKEKKVAVTIKDCRIMQSTYPTSKGKFELHCNPGTKILENPQKEFDIRSDTVYTHGTILSKLEAMQDTVRKQVVTVCGKIVDVKSCCEVTRKSDLVTLKMQECILADSSMMVKLNIWEGDIDKVVKGSSYQFINVKVKEYDGERYLSTNEDSEINKIEDIPGTLSTKIMPSGLTKIPGEISAVQSVFKYKKCTSQACSGKVKEVNTTIGECNKCRRSVKLKLCADSVCVKFTIQGQNDTCYDVTAFEQVVNLIIGNNFSCTAPDSETDKIEHLLFKASPATFFLNHEDVVIKVERED